PFPLQIQEGEPAALTRLSLFVCRARATRGPPSLAGWQSGHAAACKAVYAGSIPTPASKAHPIPAVDDALPCVVEPFILNATRRLQQQNDLHLPPIRRRSERHQDTD